jgi:hypothetical protein
LLRAWGLYGRGDVGKGGGSFPHPKKVGGNRAGGVAQASTSKCESLSSNPNISKKKRKKKKKRWKLSCYP